MKIFFVVIFFLIIDLYFYFGTESVIKESSFQNTYKIIYWLLCVLFYIGIIYLVNKAREGEYVAISTIHSSVFFIFFAAKIIGITPLIIDDIIRFFKIILNTFSFKNEPFDLGRLLFLKKSALIIGGVITTTLLLGIKWGRYNFKKNYTDIFIKNWNLDNYKIIQISDLHLGSFDSIDKLNTAVEMINEESADLVVFTGDLVNNFYHEAIPYIETLGKIKAKDGKFSILGNHDYGDYTPYRRGSGKWKDNFKKIVEIQNQMGFEVLMNESRIIKRKGNMFNLVGVENWGAGSFTKDGDLDLAMKNVNDKLPTILLSHDPSHWKEVVFKSKYKIDLQLSGHTHGMQFGIEIPGFKWSPIKYRYENWAGLYKKNNKMIYVNRGLGHLGYAGRVGIMPDISILNFKAEI